MAAFRRVARAQWKDFVKALTAQWGLPGDVDDVQLDSLEDTSQPFHLKFHLHQDQYFVVPSASVSSVPSPRWACPPVKASAKNKDPLNIGPEGRYRLPRPPAISHANYTVRTPTNGVKMSRDYGDYSSTYSLTKGILEGERKLVVKTNEVAAVRRSDYESFRNAAHSDEDPTPNCTGVTPEGQSADSASKLEGTADELQKAGMKSLNPKTTARRSTS